jgi:hypothetical protein
MRKLIVAMLLPAALSGCATGYATNWFQDSTSIINPQLLRYGLDVEQSRCVGERAEQAAGPVAARPVFRCARRRCGRQRVPPRP